MRAINRRLIIVNRHIALSLAVALMLSVQPGCRDASQRETAAVHGTVTFRGQPLAGANIFFVTDKGPRASADTDSQGRYRLMTYRTGDGAVPGDFNVGISKYVADPATAKDPVPGMKNEIPEKYGNPTTSGLSAKVVAGKSNEFNFDLAE